MLVQDVEQFQALQNLGVILVISKGDLSICLCIFWEKGIMWWQHISEKRSYMADDIVTNTIMAAPDTLLGVAKIGFIIYKLAKNTNLLYYLLPVDILNWKYIIMSSKSSSSYFITTEVIIGLVQIRVGNVTSWWTVKHLLTYKVQFILSKISKLYICFVWNVFNDTMWQQWY